MFRKLVLGVVFAALAGGLVYGGIYRTAARLESEREPQSQGFGQNKVEEEKRIGENGSGSRGQGNNRNSDESGMNSSEDHQESQASITSSAVVVDVTDDSLVLLDQNGTEIIVEGRAWQYANDMGFIASIDDSIEFAGFYEDVDHFEVSWISNITNGSSVSIRSDDGRPNWAGGNRRGGNGGGGNGGGGKNI